MLHAGQSVTLQRSLDLGSRLAWSAMVRRPLVVGFGAGLDIATSFRAACDCELVAELTSVVGVPRLRHRRRGCSLGANAEPRAREPARRDLRVSSGSSRTSHRTVSVGGATGTRGRSMAPPVRCIGG